MATSKPASDRARPNVIDLEKHVDKRIRVKFAGGREVVGTLKGFDGLVNIVLDDCTEYMRDPTDLNQLLEPVSTRPLGLVVCRGTNLTVVAPDEGFTAIANPFTE
jgi:U6 snRNA-associated Sm-like protein LSm7